MKQCISCHRFKEKIEFSKNKATKDGLDNKCKQCIHDQRNQYFTEIQNGIRTINHRSNKEACVFEGQLIGRLTIIKFAEKDKWGHRRWLCKCKCGKEKIISGRELIRKHGSTKSCGCLGEEIRNKLIQEKIDRKNIQRKNRELYKKLHSRKTRQEKWLAYFKTKYGENPKCGVCGKTLVWQQKNGTYKTTACFDHPSDNIPIKICPSIFYYANDCNEENIKLWESCSFGILCHVCNRKIPTKNRKKIIIQIMRYVFPEKAIQLHKVFGTINAQTQ